MSVDSRALKFKSLLGTQFTSHRPEIDWVLKTSEVATSIRYPSDCASPPEEWQQFPCQPRCDSNHRMTQ